MFLYIYRIQARLKSSMSASKLRAMIDDTPRGRDFDEAYERDLQAIPSLEEDDERERAVAILRWVFFAARPLTVRELAEALIVSADEDNTMAKHFPKEDLPDEWHHTFVEEQITGLCGLLIDLRGKEAGKPIMDQEVHFVHFTIKEYLSRPDRLKFPVSSRNDFLDTFQAHEKVVKACLRYMCYKDFIQTDHSTKQMFDEKLAQYPFLRFADISWTFHMSQCRPFSAEIIQRCNAWFDPANLRWMSYSEVVGSNANWTFENFMGQFLNSYPNPLFYASLWGLVHTMRYLIERGAGVNVIGGLYGSPLQAASAHGYVLAVEILFLHGADVNLAGGKWGGALQAAADNAQEQIVDILLAHNASVNLTGGIWNSAIVAASNRFQLRACRVIRRLLEAGANIDSTTDEGETALHRAAAEGAPDLIDLMLDKGASINAISNSGQTPVQKASYLGKNESIKCLLKRGANVEISSYDGGLLCFLLPNRVMKTL